MGYTDVVKLIQSACSFILKEAPHDLEHSLFHLTFDVSQKWTFLFVKLAHIYVHCLLHLGLLKLTEKEQIVLMIDNECCNIKYNNFPITKIAKVHYPFNLCISFSHMYFFLAYPYVNNGNALPSFLSPMYCCHARILKLPPPLISLRPTPVNYSVIFLPILDTRLNFDNF